MATLVTLVFSHNFDPATVNGGHVDIKAAAGATPVTLTLQKDSTWIVTDTGEGYIQLTDAIETQLGNNAWFFDVYLNTTDGNTTKVQADGTFNITDRVATTSDIRDTGVPQYSNNAAALAGGLKVGNTYRLGGDPDQLCIVH